MRDEKRGDGGRCRHSQYNCSHTNFNGHNKTSHTLAPADVTTSETGILLFVKPVQLNENTAKKLLENLDFYGIRNYFWSLDDRVCFLKVGLRF